MSFQDSSVTPMDGYGELGDDETISDGLEIGEHFDLLTTDIHTQSQTETVGSNAAGGHSTSVEEDPSNAGKQTRTKKSIVHQEMTIITLPGGGQRWKCNYCAKLYKYDGTGGSTSNALKHVHKCVNRQVALEKGEKDNSIQAKLNVNSFGRNGAPYLANWKYNHSKVKELAAHLVLGHEYPFMMMEGVIFNRFLLEIYPGYRRITRHAVKAECEVFYANEKKNENSS